MNKPRKCDWCGETIEGAEVRVKLPVMWDGPAFTYHAQCYVHVYAEDCRRWLAGLDIAPDTSPAPAPDPPSGATPDAAASDSASPELQGPPSFGEHEYTAASPEDIAEAMRRACTAADETITVDWFETRIGRIEMSESGVIGWFEDALPAERVRLLSYIWDRWNT